MEDVRWIIGVAARAIWGESTRKTMMRSGVATFHRGTVASCHIMAVQAAHMSRTPLSTGTRGAVEGKLWKFIRNLFVS